MSLDQRSGLATNLMTNGRQPNQLLLCEGPDDREFFRALIEARALPKFRARHNGTREDPRGGNTKFGPGLRAHYEISGNRRFRKVLIVSDNDDNPAESFDRVRQQVERYFGFAPGAAREIVPGPPSVMILMIPWDGERGNLEALCLDAAKNADARVSADVDNFAAQVQVDRWDNDNRKKEMWLRSNLAARCEREPFVTLRNVFTNPRHQYLIPLDDPSFRDIADVLSTFGA